MALSNVDHFFNCLEISPFFRQSLPHLKVVNRICELGDDAENMLFNEVTQ